jgi:mRNA interferase MazF
MITSAANRGWEGDVAISDLRAAGLPVPSLVRPAKLATIEARDAQRLGTLAPGDRKAVAAYLRLRLATALNPT